MEKVLIGNKQCQILARGNIKTVIYLVLDHDEDIEDKLNDLDDFLLIGYEVEDWNRDFSPWPFHMNKNFDFSGQGSETLRWLTEDCNEYVRRTYGEIPHHYPCGYSLAGLFSLWCFYESELFDGAGSMSGSLWFEGWHEYIENKYKSGLIYLSLGDKEKNTRNQIMAKVYDESIHQYEHSSKTCKCTFELNSGGHFDNVTERIVSGIRWLIVNSVD